MKQLTQVMDDRGSDFSLLLLTHPGSVQIQMQLAEIPTNFYYVCQIMVRVFAHTSFYLISPRNFLSKAMPGPLYRGGMEARTGWAEGLHTGQATLREGGEAHLSKYG